MKLMIALAALLVLCSVSRADTIYSYTSPAYDECLGSYCTGGPYALSFTFDVGPGTQLDNLSLDDPDSNVTTDVTSFTFTDGSGLAITQGNATADSFSIGTDANGNMIAWSVWADADPPVTLEYVGSNSYYTATYIDYSMTGSPPDDIQNRGYWIPVPEPATIYLIVIGLVVLIAWGREFV